MVPSIKQTGLGDVPMDALIKELSLRTLGLCVVMVVLDEDGDDVVQSYGFGSKILMRGAIETMRDDLIGVRMGLIGHAKKERGESPGGVDP